MNIYVGNLHYKVQENELKRILEEFGAVSSIKLITDKMSGRSKGFGFVEMDDSEAKNAIQSLNGKELYGRPMVVKEAIPRSY